MKPVIFLHSSWKHDIEALMADPHPQGQAALARATLNGVECVYTGQLLRVDDFRITVSSRQGHFASYPAKSMRKIGGRQ